MPDGESREQVRFDKHFLAEFDAIEVINSIDGNELQLQAIELAAIGGKELPPAHGKKRYATNRPALSLEDKQATEEFIIPLLEKTGAHIDRHPLAIIGTLEGEDPELAPVVIMSHTDTVPDGDMYDGVTGVLAGIAILQAIKDSGFRPKRNVVLASLTGEESAPFNIALFGSRALWHGLTEEELAQTNKDGNSIAEMLGEDVDMVRNPTFGPLGNELPTPAAVLELHVEQGSILEEKAPDGKTYKADIGVVESIAAPARFEVSIGEESLVPDGTEYTHSTYMRLAVEGKPGHSGATPMGTDERADGLVEIESYLQQALNEYSDMAKILSIGSIEIEGQSINKIPGLTETILRIAGNDEEKISAAVKFLKFLVTQRNQLLNERHSKFDKNPVSLSSVEDPGDTVFFRSTDILPRQKSAFSLIRAVNNAARVYADKGVVGTVGTYSTSADGKITLGVDLRGMNAEWRQLMIEKIDREATAAGAPLGEALPGSGEPTKSDAALVQKVVGTMRRFETGEPLLMNSKAGHDIQNAARAGVPTVLLFCRSEGGVAHNPNAHTKPEDMEKGARSLGAAVLELASK